MGFNVNERTIPVERRLPRLVGSAGLSGRHRTDIGHQAAPGEPSLGGGELAVVSGGFSSSLDRVYWWGSEAFLSDPAIMYPRQNERRSSDDDDAWKNEA